MNSVEPRTKNDIVTFLHHLSGTEFSQIAAFAPRRTGRMAPRQRGEITAIEDLVLQFFTFFVAVDQYASRAGLRH